MVALSDVQEANKLTFSYRSYVAVFVGATSGIGEYTATELARQLSRNNHEGSLLYLIGRNATEGDRVTKECKTDCPGIEIIWIKAQDLALLADVDRVCQEIRHHEKRRCVDREPQIDLLFMIQGKLDFGDRSETTEGLDRTMSLLYCSRIRFTTNLLPLLQAHSKTANVASVYGAGPESKLFRDDLSLRHHYSFANARSHIVHMTTMAFERLSRENSNLSLVHAYPGLVVTPDYSDPSLPLWFRAVWGFAGPLVRVVLSIPPEKAAKRVLFLASARFAPLNTGSASDSRVAVVTNGSVGSGRYAVGEDSGTVKLTKAHDGLRREGFEKVVWDHTQDAFARISSGEQFQR